MFRWKVTAAAVLSVAALTLAGCSASGGTTDASSTTGGSATGNTLTFGAIVAPTTFDPAGSQWGNASIFYQAVFDTVTRVESNGKVVPMLATKWSYNSDKTVLTMTIRKGVKFTDGSDLTAGVVKANLERFQKGTSPDASDLSSVTSIQAPDDRTLIISLNGADPALLTDLGRDPGLVASEKSLTASNVATAPVGSGPYKLDTASTVSGSSYVFTANPDYWDKSLQHYKKLVIDVYSTEAAALNAVKSGEANAVKLTDNNDNSQVKAAGWSLASNELDFAGVMLYDRGGTTNKALGNVKVRQAINMAFDRAGLLKAGGGYGSVTEQVFPKTSSAFDASLDRTYSYNPAKAKALLKEAGYPNGFTLEMPSTTLLAASTYNLLKQQLKAIGVTVQYTDVGSNYITAQLKPQFPAAFMILEQDPDWQLIQFMLSPTATWNPFHYSDPTADALIKKYQYGDTAALKQLNQYVTQQAWFAPLFRVQGTIAEDANTSITMMSTNALPSLYDIRPKS